MKKILRARLRKASGEKGSTTVGFVEKPIWKNRVFIIVSTVLVLAAIIGVVVLVSNPDPKSDPNEQFAVPHEKQRLDRALNTKVPESAEEKVTYYTSLGEAYEDTGENQKALEAYLKAAENSPDQSAETGDALNTALARLYATVGDKEKAKEYYQKQINYLKTIPDNEDTIQHLQKIKDEL